MDQEPSQIKSHIDHTRKELGENLHELQYKVKEVTDWHRYVDRYPWALVGLGFAGGAVISLAFSRSGRSYSIRQSNSSLSPQVNTPHRRSDKGAYVWDMVKNTVAGLAAAELKAFLNEAIPGFRQHYERAERQHAAGSPHSSMETGLVH